MALATASATAGSVSWAPCLIVFWRALNTGFGSRAFWTSSLNTLTPNKSLMWFVRKSIWFRSYSVLAIASIAIWRRWAMGRELLRGSVRGRGVGRATSVRLRAGATTRGVAVGLAGERLRR